MPIIFIKNGAPVPDTDVNYNGFEIPRDRVAYVRPKTDFTNNPSLITIGNGDKALSLPSDMMVFIDGEKIIPMDQILDGVSVFVHVGRKPYEINFEFTLRDTDEFGHQIFPQGLLDDIFTNVWLPDTVQKVVNTYLNKLGILEIIIKNISPATVRGSTNIPVRMKSYENVPGSSIIINKG